MYDGPLDGEDADPISDSFLQQQMDYMYSEESSAVGGNRMENGEDMEQIMRLSLRRREQEFYGDDEAPNEPSKITIIEEGPQEEETEESSNKNQPKQSKIQTKQKSMNEKKLLDKKRRVQELQLKYDRKRTSGDEAAGSRESFEQCLQFYTSKIAEAGEEELGNKEAKEIEEFINEYENAPHITVILH